MKSFKGYNLFDLFLIVLGLMSVIVSAILLKPNWIVTVYSVITLFTVFTQAKGKIATQFIGIVSSSIYTYISFSQALYGEAILHIVLILPMYIYGAFNWILHKDKANNSVVTIKNKLSKNEIITMSCLFVVLSVLTFFFLKALGTNLLVISTISFVSMLPAVYLLARRFKYNQVAFLVNDLIVLTLWLIFALNGKIEYSQLCVCFVFEVIYDIYGIFTWYKLTKNQNINQNQT